MRSCETFFDQVCGDVTIDGDSTDAIKWANKKEGGGSMEIS